VVSNILVRLNHILNLEVQGKMRAYYPGDWVSVGKQMALKLLASGHAWTDQVSVDPRTGSVIRRAKFKIRPTEWPKLEHIMPHTYDLPITLFCVPMPFVGIHAIRQENALNSWVRMCPRPEVLLIGDEEGTQEFANMYGFVHIPDLECNEYGTPLISSAFQLAQEHASNEILCYINSDIILIGLDTALPIVARDLDPFLAVGQRWDVEVRDRLIYDQDWKANLLADVQEGGALHAPGAIDFFAFRRGLYSQIPPFAIGRSAWDNWLISHVVQREIDVINVAKAAFTIHQNRSHPPATPMTMERAEERRRNRRYYDRDRNGVTGTSHDAEWWLMADGLRHIDGKLYPIHDTEGVRGNSRDTTTERDQVVAATASTA
jgi:hypothetical protein